MLALLLVPCSHARKAQGTLRGEFLAHPTMSANNYQAYPDTLLPSLTAAPAGYTPFFINHYGRHGSRWLIDDKQYSQPLEALEKAKQAGKLTARGERLRVVLQRVLDGSRGRLGELSDIGAEQHRGIAERMVANFPEVFHADGAKVVARSTTVRRCILSMQNEVDRIAALCPDIAITTDASKAEMYYMNYSDPVVKPLRSRGRDKADLDEYKDKWVRPTGMAKRLFTDLKWAKQNVDLTAMMLNLVDVVGNMQSHHAFDDVNEYSIFGSDDLYDAWRYNNARWYITSGNNPFTAGRVPHMEANLLRNIIRDADHAIAHGTVGASLRFGHESVVLPLVCLMDINGMGYSTDNLDTLDEHWASCKVFPMAANLQLVYYRNAAGDVLVKVLLNEHEASLPLQPVAGPYYRWSDVRDFYLDRIANVPQVPAGAIE